MATVRVSGPLLQLSVMWSAHTHTHTDIQLFPFQGGVMCLLQQMCLEPCYRHCGVQVIITCYSGQ